MPNVVVIGGGASGLMAAGTAAYYGANVTLLEKNSRTGRKILVTGKGRCNITNNCDKDTFIGFVFVDEPYRGNRLSELMIQSAILYAREIGYEKVYILSGEIGLYEKYGFEKLGDYKTIFGSIDQLFVKSTI